MEDLIVYDIKLTHEVGVEIPWAKIEAPLEKSRRFLRMEDLGLNTEQAKERILRQIIRKHLVEQGMEVKGAAVEICRGHT
jgi:hypothetical protein